MRTVHFPFLKRLLPPRGDAGRVFLPRPRFRGSVSPSIRDDSSVARAAEECGAPRLELVEVDSAFATCNGGNSATRPDKPIAFVTTLPTPLLCGIAMFADGVRAPGRPMSGNLQQRHNAHFGGQTR